MVLQEMKGALPLGEVGAHSHHEGGGDARARRDQRRRPTDVLPPTRLHPPPHQEGPQRGRLPAMALQGLREDILPQEQGAARGLEARRRDLGCLRRVDPCWREPEGVRRGLPRVPPHLLVHAHEVLRGHGAIAPPVQDRALDVVAGRRHVSRRVPRGQRDEGRDRDAEVGRTGTAAPSSPGGLQSQGLRRLRGQRRRGRVLPPGRQGEAHGRSADGVVGDLGAGTWVAADTHRGYERGDLALGITERTAIRTDMQGDGELGMVNTLHQRLRIFHAVFHGVSTRWLDHHLSRFVWLEQARRSDADRLQSLLGQAAAGSYENTRCQLIEHPQPFWDYWGRKKGSRQW